MYTILEKKQFSEEVFYLRVAAPEIARNRRAGQFVLVQIDTDYGERIPLTIADANANDGWIALVFQTVGATTHKLAMKKVGEKIEVILGPLGRPTHITKVGTVVCVGGGIGVAPLYPIVKAYKEAGNKVIAIIGARTKDLIIFESEMRAAADEVIVVTDDGTYGRKCLVTEPLKEFCASATPACGSSGYRAPDHDEILRFYDEAVRHSHDGIAQHDHDRRNRNVRRMPRDGGRKDEVRLRRRSRIRRSSRGF